MDLDASGWIGVEVLLDACQSVPHLKIDAWPDRLQCNDVKFASSSSQATCPA